MSEKILQSKFTTFIIGAGVLLFILFCGAYFYQFSNGLSSDQTVWGSFGSYLGGTLGAVFAFASFAVLLCTLSLQREELRLAISALEKSAKSHKKQVENHEAQKFETTFYSLLELHNQTVKDLEVTMKENDASLLFKNYSKLEASDHELDDGEYNKTFNEWKNSQQIEQKFNDPNSFLIYLKEVISTDVELSQYFRVLYQVLKFIAKNNITNAERNFSNDYLSNRVNINEDSEKMYASLVRTFVPAKILPILALHCIQSDEEFSNLEKYRALIERYSFLEHVRLSDFEDNLAVFLILDRYDYAFGDNDKIDDKSLAIADRYFEHVDISVKRGYLHRYFDKEE